MAIVGKEHHKNPPKTIIRRIITRRKIDSVGVGLRKYRKWPNQKNLWALKKENDTNKLIKVKLLR